MTLIFVRDALVQTSDVAGVTADLPVPLDGGIESGLALSAADADDILSPVSGVSVTDDYLPHLPPVDDDGAVIPLDALNAGLVDESADHVDGLVEIVRLNSDQHVQIPALRPVVVHHWILAQLRRIRSLKLKRGKAEVVKS